MGDPIRLKKKYKTPNNPFEKDRMVEELVLLGKYGLRNKKELRKHKFALSHFRQLARENRSLPEAIQKIRFVELRDSVAKLNLVSEDGSTDDILSLTIENILERRLQTFVFKTGLAKSIIQARQLIVHRHIAVGGNTIDSPSYNVKKKDEEQIKYAVNSPFYKDSSKIWSGGQNLKSSADKKAVEEF